MRYAIVSGGTVDNVADSESPLADNWFPCADDTAIGDLFDEVRKVFTPATKPVEDLTPPAPVNPPKIRRITPRAFVARLRPWWPLVEYLKTNSSDLRLDWVLLEMAGYVDLDAQDNLEAFARLKTAFEQIAGTAVPGEFPEFTLEGITQDGTEREAHTGPL